MSDFLTLNAQKREQTGKGAARRLRAAGRIPAVFYNAKGESLSISLDEKELLKVFGKTRRTGVFNLDMEHGAERRVQPALIWDVDYFPAKSRIQHVDIFGVDLNKDISIRIPLEFTGTAKGTKVGGALQILREALTVTGKPLTLPQKIFIDISNLDINEYIRIKDLSLPAGVKAGLEDDVMLAGVVLGRDDKDEEEKSAEGAATEQQAPSAA